MVSVMLYLCMFCVACRTVIVNSHYVWVWLLFCCLVWLEVFCWLDQVCSSKECVCFACDLSVRLDAPSIYFVTKVGCVFLLQR